ncbi:MAG: hypothetical protein ACRDAI_07995 [Candidatus Rhabdochlamydia sp.]
MYDYCELDDWNEPDFDPPTPADYGWIHEDDIPDLDNTKCFVEGILESVYLTGNIEKLEDCLDEICGQFDLKLPTTKPVISHSLNDFSNDLFNLGIALSTAQASQRRIL